MIAALHCPGARLLLILCLTLVQRRGTVIGVLVLLLVRLVAQLQHGLAQTVPPTAAWNEWQRQRQWRCRERRVSSATSRRQQQPRRVDLCTSGAMMTHLVVVVHIVPPPSPHICCAWASGAAGGGDATSPRADANSQQGRPLVRLDGGWGQGCRGASKRTANQRGRKGRARNRRDRSTWLAWREGNSGGRPAPDCARRRVSQTVVSPRQLADHCSPPVAASAAAAAPIELRIAVPITSVALLVLSLLGSSCRAAAARRTRSNGRPDTIAQQPMGMLQSWDRLLHASRAHGWLTSTLCCCFSDGSSASQVRLLADPSGLPRARRQQ